MIISLRRFRRIAFFISQTLAAFWLTTGCRLSGDGKGETDELFSRVPTPAVAGTNSDGPVDPPGDPDGNKIGLDDLVIVTFSGLGNETPPPHQERVKDDGTITLDLIGAVRARGKTPGQLQKEVRQLYVPRFYKSNLNVTVTGEQRYFYVQGRVRAPNRYAYGGDLTVTKAVASAGDFDDFADRREVTLFRSDGTKYTVNCNKVLTDPRLDRKVYPGDTVFVPQRWW
jgi:polysaccharide export outer membrane protein